MKISVGSRGVYLGLDPGSVAVSYDRVRGARSEAKIRVSEFIALKSILKRAAGLHAYDSCDTFINTLLCISAHTVRRKKMVLLL